MTYDNGNIFAKIINGELPCDKVFENELVIAFHDIAPQAPVHILVLPKGRFISFADFSRNASSDQVCELIRVVGKVAFDFKIENTGYRVLANHGENAHQEVAHFHIHLMGGRDLGGILKPVS